MTKKKTKISKRKFYKTVYKFVVLSEEPIDNMELSDVLNETDNGGMVGHIETLMTRPIGAQKAVRELKDAGSQPEFFRLNNNGEDEEEDF